MTDTIVHYNKFLDLEYDRCHECGGKFWGHTAIPTDFGYICGSCSEEA